MRMPVRESQWRATTLLHKYLVNFLLRAWGHPILLLFKAFNLIGQQRHFDIRAIRAHHQYAGGQQPSLLCLIAWRDPFSLLLEEKSEPSQ